MSNLPTIIVYIAASLDGFIATPDDGVDWLAPYPADYGYDAFIASVGTLVMGRATYDQMRGFGDWPHGGKRVVVLTSRPLGDDAPAGVEAWSDGVDALGTCLRASAGDVWIVGGAKAVRAVLDRGLVDRLDRFVIPALLGDGIPLFERSPVGNTARLEAAHPYADGVVRLTYAFQQ